MSRRPSPRMRKVNETIREIVADELTRLGDPGIGFVTVTGVDTAPDLRTAIVYYSVLGDQEDRSATAEALERAHARLQAAVARQARLKYTPRLSFEIDASIDRGFRIDALLHELEEERADGSGGGDGRYGADDDGKDIA